MKKLSNALAIIKSRGLLTLLSSSINLFRLFLARKLLGFKTLEMKVNDYKMKLLTNDPGISRSLVLFGTRENDKKFILEQTIKEGMKVFDIGANIGYYTIMISKLVGQRGRILAIEPSAENIELCKQNIALNNLDQNKIKILNAAVSDSVRIKQFFISEQSNLHSFHRESSASRFFTGEIRKIKTHTISSLSKKFFKPDLIRMDVEGHELEIINGLILDIKKSFVKPLICFEPHTASYTENHNFQPILKELFKYGYKTLYLSSNAKLGTSKIIKLTKQNPFVEIDSDGEIRGIFKNIKSKDTIDILTRFGGARTVLLSPGR